MTQHATVTVLRPGPRTLENCKQPGVDPEAWFPNEPGIDRPADRAKYEATARKLCAGCPLRAACLERELAQAGRDTHGIFGGTAPWERRNMLRRQRRANRQAVAS